MVNSNIFTEEDTIIPDTFIGFDLGHGESCIVSVDSINNIEPEVCKIYQGQNSFPTALAEVSDGWVIGNEALTETNSTEFEISFKCKPSNTKDWEINRPILAQFVQQCLHQLFEKYFVLQQKTIQFVVGCPTSWSTDDISCYQEALEDAGLVKVQVKKESRAALIYARDKGLIHDKESIFKDIIIIDIGSSTTDITFVNKMQSNPIDAPLGDKLGAHLIDKIILDYALNCNSENIKYIEEISANKDQLNRALVKCRQHKENFFSKPKNEQKEGEEYSIKLDSGYRLRYELNEEAMSLILNTPIPELDEQSWLACFRDILEKVKSDLNTAPELVLLTGGASRMARINEVSTQIFDSESTNIINDFQPEICVADGLARLIRWESRCNSFQYDVAQIISPESIANVIKPHIPATVRNFIEKGTYHLIAEIIPIFFERWSAGSIDSNEGLYHSLIEIGIEWENKEEGKLVQNEATKTLKKRLDEKLSTDIAELRAKYHIPPDKLNFEPYNGSLDITRGLKKVKDKFGRLDVWAGQMYAGIAKIFPKKAINIYSKVLGDYYPLIAKLITPAFTSFQNWINGDEIAEQFTNDCAQKLHEDLHKQLNGQLETLLAWVK